MISAARAAILTALVSAFVGGIALMVVGIKAYAAGREKERAVQERVIRNMVDMHRAELDARNAEIDNLNEYWRLRRQGADRAQEIERAASRDALAAVNADRGRLREQLAAVASGGVQAADDTVGACRERAAALGDVLDSALHAHAVCTGEAEDLAAGVRALREAWPTNPVKESP